MNVFVIVLGAIAAFVLGAVAGWRLFRRVLAAAMAEKIRQSGFKEVGVVSILRAMADACEEEGDAE